MASAALWAPRQSPGGDAALWLGSGLVAAAALSAVVAATREPGPTMLAWAIVAALLVAAGTVLLVLAVGYRRLTYTLTDRALLVRWLGETTIVPFAAVEAVYTGQRLVGNTRPRGIRWPGIYVGTGRARGIGKLRFFTTSIDPSALTIVALEGGALVLSARDPLAFRAALIDHVQAPGHASAAGSTATLQPAREAPWSSFWDTTLPIAAGAGLVCLLLTLAVVSMGYTGLPEQVVLRFDSAGQPSVIGSRSDVARLPLVGLAVLVLNLLLGVWVHPRDRLLAHVLWIGGAAMQAVLLVAVIRLLP